MGLKTRRNLFRVATAFFLAMVGKAQKPVHGGVRELARHALTTPEQDMEAILVEVTAPPGASTVHRHPGFVLGYVLDGELKFAINGGKPQVIKAGDTFFEPNGALHTTGSSARPDAPVRFLAFMVVPAGSPLTLPA